MSRTVLFLTAFTIGCAPASSADVFWIELVPSDRPCADSGVDENFLNARSAALTTDGKLEQSSGGAYALVTRSDDGAVLVNYEGLVLTGTEAEEGNIDASWSSSYLDESTTELPTFTSSFRQTIDVVETMTLRPRPEEAGATWSGSLTIARTSSLEYVETDVWDLEGTSNAFSQIPVNLYLEPNAFEPGTPPLHFNRFDRDDCDGDDCRLSITDDCTESFTIEALRIEDADVQDFDALSPFGREPGAVPIAP